MVGIRYHTAITTLLIGIMNHNVLLMVDMNFNIKQCFNDEYIEIVDL